MSERTESAAVTSAKLASPAARDGSFGAPFWLTYAANATMMVAVSLFFRYADLVKLLGGAELQLGLIVGTGMIGSLLVRVFQGVGIDTYGPRAVWLLSSTLFVVSCLGQLTITTLDSPVVYLWRILFQTSVAGFFGASITFISGRAAITRMAEVIGTLGTSGFVGMMIGTTLGDWLLSRSPIDRNHLNRVFLIAATLGAISLGISWFATFGHVARLRPRRRHPSIAKLIARYHPGTVLLMSSAMGFGIGLPAVFLRPYTHELGIDGIATFFHIYLPTALVTRLSIRRLPERIGIRPMIFLGLGCLILGVLGFLLVRSRWSLAYPALFIGMAHAILFPPVVAGGSGTFPAGYRGLGTTLVLAMFDLGTLFGSPVVGLIVHLARYLGLPAYPTMFVCSAVGLATCGVIYAATSKPRGARIGKTQVRRYRKKKRKALPVGAS